MSLLVAYVVANGCYKHGADILCGIGQSSVRAGGDALHALRTVFRDVHRRLSPGDILALCGPTGCTHHTKAGQGAGGLMVAKIITKFAVELLHSLERMAFLFLRHSTAWATTTAATCGLRHLDFTRIIGCQHWVAHAGCVDVVQLAIFNLCYALKAADHHLHVRFHDLLTKTAELFLICLSHDVVILLLGQVVVLEKARDLEKSAEE